MKKVLLLMALLINCLVSFSQIMNANLALRKKMLSSNPGEKMFLLVKGDIDQIRTFTKANNGVFLNSAGDIASVKLPVNSIAGLLQKSFVKQVGSDVHHYKVMNDTMRMLSHVEEVHAGQSPISAAYKGRGVVLGFIDSGIDYRHPDFKDSLGHTRIDWLWDMTLTDSASPQPYGYGQEFSGAQIDAGLATAHTGEAEYGHGTYVAGIGAGNGASVGHFQGVAPESRIVCVAYDFQIADTVPRLAHAVEYIFAKAQQMGMPCVINASLGDYIGSHDGLDLESQYISNLLNQQSGRVLVASAGNIGPTYPFHVGRTSVAGDTVFTWFKYNGAQFGGAYIQVYADTPQFRNIRFSIGADKVSPYYESAGALPYTTIFPSIGHVTNQQLMRNGHRIGVVQTAATLTDSVYLLEVYVMPDSTDYYWRFMTTGDGRYDSWSLDWNFQNIPSDTTFPEIVKYFPPDTTESIVSGIACLNNVITVGNYYNTDRHVDVDSVLQVYPNDHPRQLAENSGRGPTRDNRNKPDITAPGHHIISTAVLSQIPGLISAQPYKVALGGYHITGGGTSASAPVVAGVATLYLEQNPGLGWQEVKNAILNCAYQDNFTWGPFPNNAWGAGKVDAFSTLTVCAGNVNTPVINDDADVIIYPNPGSEIININYYSQHNYRLSLFNLIGEKLFTAMITENNYNLLTRSYESGIYIIRLENNGNEIINRRIEIIH